MREKVQRQLPLPPALPVPVEHGHARELEAISAVLDAHPQIVNIVFEDLPKGRKDPTTGRPGMTAEQVLRALLLKQMHGFSYERLAFHLNDSISFRAFCRLDPFQPAPRSSTLQRNIKKLSPSTLQEINELLVLHAWSLGIEKGRKVRADCTVIESNIHDPTDGELLWDVVRVLTREMKKANETFGIVFTNRTRRAKRRSLDVWNAKSEKARKQAYEDLLIATNDCLVSARRVLEELAHVEVRDLKDILVAESVTFQLKRFLELGKRVGSQTFRRVVLEEKVPAKEKIVSIFEEHTDIIVKDRRETQFGHKLCLATGASGLILDAMVLDGNPADSTLATEMVQRQEDLLGRVPRQVAFDGGFSSRANLGDIKERGVQDVCFSKGRGLEVTDMVRSDWVFKKLRNFRAGIEAGISFLKRCFGLRRCTWSGLESFYAYTWASIVSANLLILARHMLRDGG